MESKQTLSAQDMALPKTIADLPASVEELTQFSLGRRMISSNMRLCPGRKAKSVPLELTEMAYGQYGLQLICPKTAEAIAICGFFVADDRMYIPHTPQGSTRYKISREARRSLFGENRDFRNRLMQTLIEIARKLKLKEIVGIAAESHPKVAEGHISAGRGAEIINKVFEENGFLRGQGNHFLLSL
jgi:hypothetical protein